MAWILKQFGQNKNQLKNIIWEVYVYMYDSMDSSEYESMGLWA